MASARDSATLRTIGPETTATRTSPTKPPAAAIAIRRALLPGESRSATRRIAPDAKRERNGKGLWSADGRMDGYEIPHPAAGLQDPRVRYRRPSSDTTRSSA